MNRAGPFSAGLCSVTLRHMDIEAVVRSAAQAGLEAIEWGADVHVPPGDIAAAQRAVRATADAGLRVSSYGSYYLRSGTGGRVEWSAIVDSARILGAPRIRIWAGDTGSAECSQEARSGVVVETRRACDEAAEHGITVAFEFHGGTLTDTPASTLRLLGDVDRPNAMTYWQPPVGAPNVAALEGLRLVLDHVAAVHVFSWWPERQRLRLHERADLWKGVFAMLRRTGRDFDALLEFLPNGDHALLPQESRTLRNLGSFA